MLTGLGNTGEGKFDKIFSGYKPRLSLKFTDVSGTISATYDQTDGNRDVLQNSEIFK
jgi:hypothetical protein